MSDARLLDKPERERRRSKGLRSAAVTVPLLACATLGLFARRLGLIDAYALELQMGYCVVGVGAEMLLVHVLSKSDRPTPMAQWALALPGRAIAFGSALAAALGTATVWDVQMGILAASALVTQARVAMDDGRQSTRLNSCGEEGEGVPAQEVEAIREESREHANESARLRSMLEEWSRRATELEARLERARQQSIGEHESGVRGVGVSV